jgi:hypothetical protein
VCRSALALIYDLAVPLEAVRIQRIKDEFGCTGLLARWVNVFNTKKPEPIMGSGPVGEGANRPM